MNKTTEQLIEEFLANGGEIEKLPYVDPETKHTVGSTTKKTPQIMTLAEGEEMFGKVKKRKKKIKEPDFSGIDLDLIPEHLHHIIKKPASDEQDGNHKGGSSSETN
jgi:hypothetical protein